MKKFYAGLVALTLSTPLLAATNEEIFSNLESEGYSAGAVIAALVENGLSWADAVSFAVGQASTIKFATALTNTGVCESTSLDIAQQVAAGAKVSAPGQSATAVAAIADKSLGDYGSKNCLIINNPKPPGTSMGSSTGNLIAPGAGGPVSPSN